MNKKGNLLGIRLAKFRNEHAALVGAHH